MKETKKIIQYLKESDLHSNEFDDLSVNRSGMHTASTSSSMSMVRPQSTEDCSDEDNGNKLFNQIYHSGR